MQLEPLTRDQIQNTLQRAIEDAVSFVDSEIAPERTKAQRYFAGETDLGHEEGRSKVVATKARDAVRAVKPALMRIFMQSGRPVEFAARNPQSAQAADQATKYAQAIFERNNGYAVLLDVVQDALVKKNGIIKAYYDETSEVKIDNYSGLSPDQWALVVQNPEVEVLDQAEEVTIIMSEMGPVEDVKISGKVARTSARGEIRFESVAPEDFFIDRGAKDVTSFYVCGHSTEGRIGDLVEMGFAFEDVIDFAGSKSDSMGDEEEYERTGWSKTEDDDGGADPTMRPVVITEAYMRMDIEGVGIPRLYKFICAGDDYEVLDYELCDYQPFAVFEVDPEPHTFYGRSLVDIILDDQDASTVLLRGLLDSITWLNNPRMEVVEAQVNMDDVLNNEFGGIIRTKGPGNLREITMGGASSAALPAMQYYDQLIKGKTGIVGAGMGLDVDALSSQTAAGVRLADQSTNAAAELMARTLAEGGMKQLFRTIAQLARQHPNPGEMIRVDGQFVPVDPQSWSTDMDLIVNVGIGTGRQEERLAALSQVIQMQLQAWQMGGPQNGLVGLTNIRNALVDAAMLGGLHNPDRYFQPMTPEIEQQLMQQAAQAAQQQQQSDPTQAYLQAEMAKVQQRAQADVQKAQIAAQKAQADVGIAAEKMRMDDDRERDKMAQDMFLEIANLLGKYGLQVDPSVILAQQAAPRF
jgi:hypothetical protein